MADSKLKAFITNEGKEGFSIIFDEFLNHNVIVLLQGKEDLFDVS